MIAPLTIVLSSPLSGVAVRPAIRSRRSVVVRAEAGQKAFPRYPLGSMVGSYACAGGQVAHPVCARCLSERSVASVDASCRDWIKKDGLVPVLGFAG